jgi:hypothetical protein
MSVGDQTRDRSITERRGSSFGEAAACVPVIAQALTAQITKIAVPRP